MSYRPQRTFNGTQGNPSTDTMGPEQLSHDIDELCKMFNPTSIHSDGSAGGVTADNLNFTGLDINEIGGVASGDIKAIRVKMNGDIEYTTDGETYHPAFAREANYLPLAGGTMSGTLNMNNNKITNLPTPEVGSDPATKNYTDAIRTALEVALALKAPIDSPTFTGTPTAPTPSTEDNSTQIATTAFTQAVAAGVAGNTYSKAAADAKFETIANANKLVKDVSYNSETGTFTIVTQDGTTTTIDTNIEKIPVSVSIIQSGSTYKLRITNEDGSYSECDVSAMFNAITFVDSTEITFTETTNQDGSKNVTASIKPGSIVGSKLDPDYKDILDALVDRAETAETNAQNSADNASDSATAAAGSASAASGSASAAASSVTSASQYASAAEGFKNQASNSATAAASSATEAATSASNASTSETNAAASASSAATSASNAATSASDAASDAQRTQELTNEAMEYATDAAGSQIDAETAARNAAASASTASTKASQAATSASNASTSETNAANSATAAAASAASVGTQASDAEAAARGTRNGVPVSSTDEFYNDNAKYYKDQAAAIVGPQQPKITATGILKGEGDGVVSAAVAGTDYQAPLPSQSGQSGKFLTTNGSALSWADNPPELFQVFVFYDSAQQKYVADKTCAEIEAAYNDGKLPCLRYRNDPYYLVGSENMDGVIYLTFISVDTYGSLYTIHMDSVAGVNAPVNTQLAPLDSPDFTGTPTAPDLTSTSAGTQIANKNYVDNHTPDLSGYMQKGVDYVTAGRAEGYPLGESATAEGEYVIAIGQGSHAEGAWSESSLNIKITGALNATTLDWDYGQRQGRLSYAPGQLIEYSEHLTDDYNEDIIHFSRITSIDFENKKLYLESPLVPDSSESVTARYMTVITPSAGGDFSHSEGYNSRAIGGASHAEGSRTRAFGDYSHAEGDNSSTYGLASHAEGATAALGAYQHTFGKNNIYDYKNIAVQGGYNGRKLGDINADGLINQEDLDLVNAHLSGQSTITDPTSLVCADIDGDGEITQSDADELERFIDSSEGTLWDRMYDLNGDWTALRFPETKTIQWQFTFTPRDASADTIEDIKSDYAEIVSFSVSSNQVTLIAKDLPIWSPQFFLYLNTEYDPNYAGEYIEVVGNGLKYENNARTLDWLGNEVLAGKLTVGADPTENMDVATKQYVDSKEVPPEVFYINVTGSGTQAAPYTADHTYAEITTALSAGKLPIVIHNGGYYIYGGNSGDYDFYQAGATYIRSFFVTSANVWSDQIDSIVTSVNGLTGDIETNDVLPDQTGEDGKFLMTDGSDVSWEAVEPEVFVVTITSSNNTYTADKTYAEITAAADAGKIVVALFRGLFFYLNWVDYNNFTGAWFTAVTYFPGYAAAVVDAFNLSSANVWTFTEIQTQNRITATGILKGDGAGGVTAAVAGTDYVKDYVTAGQKNGTTLGFRATAEGNNTSAIGYYSHAEGDNTSAIGHYSHAEGSSTTASGNAAHAEGSSTTSSGESAHAEGSSTTASGESAHAEGSGTSAGGTYAHAEGYFTNARRKSQHVFGEYNVLDTTGTTGTQRGAYIEIVGKGTADNARSNARTLDWSGNEVLAGKLTVGAAPTANMDVATKQYVDATRTVAQGGTGATSFTANCVIMSGSSTTAALTTRAVTNNTATSGAVSANTNIPTMNTLRFAINRTTSVAAADTGYTTYMARGEALNSADTNPSVNGAISWTYA